MTRKNQSVGTSSGSADRTSVGEAGQSRRPRGALWFIREPRRRRVNTELVEHLEEAGLVDAAEVAKRLAS